MPSVHVYCFLFSYAFALVAEMSRLAWRNRISHWVMLGLTTAGLVAQTIYLLLRFQQTRLPPLLSSMQDWLLVLAWLAVLIYLIVALLDRELAIGLIVLPLVVAMVIASQSVPDASPDDLVNVSRNWTMLHVSLLVFGIAGILMGLVSGLMYLWQHYRLKHRQTMQPGLTLPSLERLERFTRLAILVSVPLLTLGMVLGVVLVLQKHDGSTAQRVLGDPIIIGSGVCWLLMTGVFVWLLSKRGEPGRKVAWLTVWSCGFLLLTTIAAQMLTRVTHSIHSGKAAAPAAATEERTL